MASSDMPSQSDHDARFRREVREGFDSDIRGVSSEDDKLDLLAVQQGLDVLWHMFLQAAKEFDLFHKSLHPTDRATTPWERYGFADSLQATWDELLATGTALQQCSLAAISAKVLTVGVCRELIGLTALWYLRETLETDDDTETFALLRTAVVWIETCRHLLLTFLAITVWRRCLQLLSHNTDPVVAKEAKKGFMAMIFCGRDLDYDVPGETKFTEKLQAAMEAELVRSGEQSVDGDDIDI
ncbi:hypothetical protein BU16DRAFT_551455 [Lophium mytilinum]|uniref:Uncharacterized protein n=1 Tax=Lophium mytilinum TaxID=390894 RepID=A0A6A6QJE5_9PEZI|nr:hypothetical protein BU16DRAFT_551455 [Lophium mytilinum]